MTDNILIEETLDELIRGMKVDKSTFYKSLQGSSVSYIHRNRRLSVSKSALFKAYVLKPALLGKLVKHKIKRLTLLLA
jgi:hypothetical protein